MDNLPSMELLEETHRFPGPYMFKVIGRVEEGFAARIVAAVREELRAEVDPPFTLRHSQNGRHVSVTLEPQVENVAQVLAIYNRIRATSGLVMLW